MWSEVRSVTPCNYPHLSTPNQCLAGFVQIVSLCAELFEGSPRQATLSGSNIDRSRNYNGPCGWSEMWVIARFAARVRELVGADPVLSASAEPLLAIVAAMVGELARLTRRVLEIARAEPVC